MAATPAQWLVLSIVALVAFAVLEWRQRLRQRAEARLGTWRLCTGTRAVAIVWLLIATVCMGALRWQLAHDHVVVGWPQQPVTCMATVVSAPHHSPRTERYTVRLAGHNIYAYVQRDAQGHVPHVSVGDSVQLLRVQIRSPQAIPDAPGFDYPRYLYGHAIAGTAYVPHASWIPQPARDVSPTFRLRVQRQIVALRQTITQRYGQAGFPPEVQGILEALTIGQKDHLTDDVRDAYRASGASHLLALSGLHVTVILLLLMLPGTLLGRSRWLLPVALAVLWLFAVLAGMTPSIQRAVILCTVYAVATQLGSDRFPLNALSLTALLMLLVKPYVLFDVGFQLSFASMAGITLAVPLLDGWRQSHLADGSGHTQRQSYVGRVGQKIVSLSLVSVAAQMGTAPLVLYHFGTFPTYFLLTNLVAVPLIYIVMAFLILWWMPLPIAWHAVVGHALTAVVTTLNRFLSWVAALPASQFHVDRFTLPEVLLLWLLIVLVSRALLKKHPQALYISLAVSALLLAFRLLGV